MSTRQLLEYILQRDHIKARKVFEDLMVDRLRDVVDTKKMEVGMKIMQVEEEQIDELSKKTLGSYVKKASSDAANLRASAALARRPRHYAKAEKRLEGVRKAADKLTKEETEQIDELSKKTLASYAKKASLDKAVSLMQSADGYDKKAAGKRFEKRYKGVNRAIDKLAKEETEQIDELSKKTLASYAKKASLDKAVSLMQSADGYDKKAAGKRFEKRYKGVNRAIDKLAKEETEQIDELSKKTLASYAKKASLDKAVSLMQSADGYDKKAAGKRFEKRYKGVNRAIDKLAKEETEQIDELSKKTLASYAKKASLDKAVSLMQSADGYDKKAAGKRFEKRYKGVNRAIDKLAKEETEQIDELSRKTLTSYREKASKSMHKAIDDTMDAKGQEAKDEKYKKYSKRFDGIKSANKRLSK